MVDEKKEYIELEFTNIRNAMLAQLQRLHQTQIEKHALGKIGKEKLQGLGEILKSSPVVIKKPKTKAKTSKKKPTEKGRG